MPAGKRLVSVAPPVWAALPGRPGHTASLFAAGADGGKAQAGKPINDDVLIQYKRNGAVGDCFRSAPPRPKIPFRIRRPVKMPRTYRRPFIAGTDGGKAQAGEPSTAVCRYRRCDAAGDYFRSAPPRPKIPFRIRRPVKMPRTYRQPFHCRYGRPGGAGGRTVNGGMLVQAQCSGRLFSFHRTVFKNYFRTR